MSGNVSLPVTPIANPFVLPYVFYSHVVPRVHIYVRNKTKILGQAPLTKRGERDDLQELNSCESLSITSLLVIIRCHVMWGPGIESQRDPRVPDMWGRGFQAKKTNGPILVVGSVLGPVQLRQARYPSHPSRPYVGSSHLEDASCQVQISAGSTKASSISKSRTRREPAESSASGGRTGAGQSAGGAGRRTLRVGHRGDGASHSLRH